MYEYKIKKIDSKSGILKDVHRRALNKRCKIEDLIVGQSAILKYEVDEGKGSFKNLYTSVVLNIKQDCDMIVIETLNSFYWLEELRD